MNTFPGHEAVRDLLKHHEEEAARLRGILGDPEPITYIRYEGYSPLTIGPPLASEEFQ